MPGGGQASQASSVTRNKENVRISESVPAKDKNILIMLTGKAVQASGALAINDGLYDGTLSMLDKAFREWEAAKPDQLIGTKKMGEEMAIWAGYSWMTHLLPYVGQNELYSQLDFNKNCFDKANIRAAFTVVPAFLNPADSRSTWRGYPFPGMALTHFAGMSGIEDGRNVVAAELPRSDPRAGIFGYDRIARASDITDGASQTIMVIGTGEVVAPWVTGGGSTIRGARQPYFDKFTGFGSRGLSKAGTYVLFADGSSRVISADIDPEVFKAMCTMHGAEQIDMNKLVTQGQ